MSNNGVDCNGILGVYCFSPTCGVAGLHECRQWPDGRRARTHIHSQDSTASQMTRWAAVARA
ncbi:hypothetical protein ACQJBY_015330 [Aegilops geniculata]